MFDDINKIIENNITDTDLVNFCAIIGSNPSQGARSPTLWNKVFSAEKKKVKMLPLDVKPENVGHLFHCLQEHSQCLGGAVAVPYKEKLFNLTGYKLMLSQDGFMSLRWDTLIQTMRRIVDE